MRPEPNVDVSQTRSSISCSSLKKYSSNPTLVTNRFTVLDNTDLSMEMRTVPGPSNCDKDFPPPKSRSIPISHNVTISKSSSWISKTSTTSKTSNSRIHSFSKIEKIPPVNVVDRDTQEKIKELAKRDNIQIHYITYKNDGLQTKLLTIIENCYS